MDTVMWRACPTMEYSSARGVLTVTHGFLFWRTKIHVWWGDIVLLPNGKIIRDLQFSEPQTPQVSMALRKLLEACTGITELLS